MVRLNWSLCSSYHHQPLKVTSGNGIWMGTINVHAENHYIAAPWAVLYLTHELFCGMTDQLKWVKLKITTMKPQQRTNCLMVFYHFVGLPLKGVKTCYQPRQLPDTLTIAHLPHTQGRIRTCTEPGSKPISIKLYKSDNLFYIRSLICFCWIKYSQTNNYTADKILVESSFHII